MSPKVRDRLITSFYAAVHNEPAGTPSRRLFKALAMTAAYSGNMEAIASVLALHTRAR